MNTFIIIVSVVLILALLINYLTKDKIFEEEDLPYIQPLKNDFKPILTDLYNEDDVSTPAIPKSSAQDSTFPPNFSEAYIEFYYQSLIEKEHPEELDVNKQIHTVNMYVESHYELNLSLLGKGLTIEMIQEAYEKLLNEHVNSIAMGKPPRFNIADKQKAKAYLIAHYTKNK